MLCALLQRNQNPSGAEQGCAALSRRSASWNHQITRNPRRTSSPIRPDLVFAIHSIGEIKIGNDFNGGYWETYGYKWFSGL
jgi:hypothetical protein